MDITELRDEATTLLRDLIRVDTSNPPGRETPAALVVRDYLEANGVACELVARDPERANVIARIRGSGDGPSLALLGHTDVVPADAEDWSHDPFGADLDEDGYVWGRGACDMKNELATRCVAIAALARSGFVPRGDLLLISQADEEDGTDLVGMPWLLEARPDLRCDYAIDEGGGARLELADGRIAYTLQVGEKATLPATITATRSPFSPS
jgi:acetylornithine deacetylase/succinyl-diaminopimelate desuccinylase-like protein